MNKEKTNKKKLVIVSGISLLTILGGTLAYFQTNSDIDNIFKTGIYQNKIVENFTSPTDWTPGDRITKEVSVTNTGNVDMAVRATITESWTNANGEELPLVDQDNNRMALIKFEAGWEANEDGYYYYGTKSNLNRLGSGNTTTPFISAVKFNENAKASLTEEVSDDGHTITYSSDGTGYDNATYKLTIKIETIQYNQANSLWQ